MRGRGAGDLANGLTVGSQQAAGEKDQAGAAGREACKTSRQRDEAADGEQQPRMNGSH